MGAFQLLSAAEETLIVLPNDEYSVADGQQHGVDPLVTARLYVNGV